MSEDVDLTPADYIIESIELEDNDDLNELFSALSSEGGEQAAPEVEIDDRPLRPPPSFGSLADPGAKRAQGSVFDPDRFQGEGDEPVPVEQIELGGEDEAKQPDGAAPAAAGKPGPAPGFPNLKDDTPPAEAPPPPQLGGEEAQGGSALRDLWNKRREGASAKQTGEEKAGIVGLLKGWLAGLAADEEEDEGVGPKASGVDASPPKRRGLLARFCLASPAEREEEEITERDRSGFAELIRPLPGSEVKRLQAELAAEEPIFVRLERSRAAAVRRQTLAFYVGLALLVAFFAAFQTSYLTSVLPAVEVPQAIAEPPVAGVEPEAWREGVGAALFALGLLLPFAALFAAVDGTRRLLQLADGLRAADIFLGAAGLLSAVVILLALAEARVLFAAAWTTCYWVVRSLYVGWEERRREYG